VQRSQAATILVAMASGKNVWRLSSSESRQLATYRFKEKLEKIIIKNRMNLINSTSGGIICLSLFPSHHSESRMRKLKMSCGSKWQI